MLGWFELGGRFHLAVEAFDGIGRSDFPSGDHLHRHQPFHPPVLGLVDHAHATLAQLLQQDVFAKVLHRGAQRRTVFGNKVGGKMFRGSHSIVDRLKLFRQVGMTRPEGVQVFGMSWPIAVATSGVILVDDQVIGELFDGAEQRIAGNVVRQPWPGGKRNAACRRIGVQATCATSPGRVPWRPFAAGQACRLSSNAIRGRCQPVAPRGHAALPRSCPATRPARNPRFAAVGRSAMRSRIGSKLRRSIPIAVLTAARLGQPIHRPSFVPRQQGECPNGPQESTTRFLPYSTSDTGHQGGQECQPLWAGMPNLPRP